MKRLSEKECDIEVYDDDFEMIECKICNEYKEVEKGTWALSKGMCEHCYCIYQGG